MNKKVALVVLAGLLVLGGCKSSDTLENKAATKTEVQININEVSEQKVIELKNTIENAQDGQVIEIEAGVYRDLGRVTIKANNVVVRAEEAGEVVISGAIQFIMKGEGNTVDSLIFKDGGAVIETENGGVDITGVVGIFGKNNTFSNNLIHQFNDYEYEPDAKGKYPNIRWITIGGEENKVLNNTLDGKHKRGAMLVVQTSEKLEKATIEGNIFKDITPLDLELIAASNPAMARTNRNDRQAIRFGDSTNSQFPSKSVIRNNIFDTINGEVEMISVKACDLIIEGNTVRRSNSLISLRHGNSVTVRNNVILGDGVRHTGGIRIYDMNHVIENNYIEGVLGTSDTRGGIVFNTGVNDVINGEKLDQSVKGKELSKQWTPKDILVKNNTVINSAQGILVSDKVHKVSLTDNSQVDTVYSGTDITFEDNLVIAEEAGTLTFKERTEEKFKLVNPIYEGNVFYGPREGMEELPQGVSEEKPTYERVDGLLVSTSKDLGAHNLTLLTEENTGSTIVVK